MKDRKHTIFNISDNVARIDCNIVSGDVIIVGSASAPFTAKKTRRCRLKISESDGVLKIRQSKAPLFRRASITITVPAYCVPDVSIKTAQGRINFTDGSYGNLDITSGDADVIICRSSFENCNIKCGRLKLYGKHLSVNGSFDGVAEEGGMLMDNAACGKLGLKYKSGDMGFSRLDCPDSLLAIERGNLNAILNGSASDYTLNLMSKNGTCNRGSVYGGEKAFKAYCGYGNLVVDFTEKDKEVAYYGNDDVAEDSRVARGS